MNRKKSTFLVIAFLAICFFVYIMRGNFNKGDYSKEYYDLNTVSTITLYNTNKSSADEILNDCGKILLDIDNKMSKTRDYSEVSKINENAGKSYVKVSDETFYVVKNALDFSRLSNGVFDISIGPIVDLWAIGTDNANVPDKSQIDDKLNLINYKNILIDEADNSIKLSNKNMKIDLGAIAKGYAADKIYEYLKEQNVESAIIDLGGNIFILGEKSNNELFKIGIQDPTNERGNAIATLDIKDKSVVTSGIYERYIEKDGVIYHHMINPSTGYPFENNLSSVTIVSDSSLNSDALSTTLFGLGIEKGMKLIEDINNADAIFIDKDKNIYTSSGLKDKLNLTDNSFKLID